MKLMPFFIAHAHIVTRIQCYFSCPLFFKTKAKNNGNSIFPKTIRYCPHFTAQDNGNDSSISNREYELDLTRPILTTLGRN